MTRSRRMGAVLLSLLAGGACFAACDASTSEPGDIEPALSSAPDGMVPFRVQEAAWTPADANPVVCEPALAGVVLPDRMLAAGTGTHMGRVSSVISGSSCTVNLATGVVSMVGSAVHSAANGDRLYADWTGTIGPTGLGLDVSFTGGTGRFEGATGWATGGGSMDPTTGTGEWILSGRIAAPGR